MIKISVILFKFSELSDELQEKKINGINPDLSEKARVAEKKDLSAAYYLEDVRFHGFISGVGKDLLIFWTKNFMLENVIQWIEDIKSAMSLENPVSIKMLQADFIRNYTALSNSLSIPKSVIKELGELIVKSNKLVKEIDERSAPEEINEDPIYLDAFGFCDELAMSLQIESVEGVEELLSEEDSKKIDWENRDSIPEELANYRDKLVKEAKDFLKA